MSAPHTKRPPLLNFACQSLFLTLGKEGGFKTVQDYFRFTADCGFDGVTLPVGTPVFDYDLAVSSEGYMDDHEAMLHGLGLKEGFHNVEWHVLTQCCSLPESRKLRFGHFVDPTRFMSWSAMQIQELAVSRLKRFIDKLSKRPKKQRKIVGFCGGRGYSAGQAKWSAWPKWWKQWVLASLVNDWEEILIYAADRGVTIHFELGHPENDLLSGSNFHEFRCMLLPQARKGLGLQSDGSHFANMRTNPMPHFRKAVEPAHEGDRVAVTNHFKWGNVTDRGDGHSCVYGAWDNWSVASSTFNTYGLTGSDANQREFSEFHATCHAEQEAGNPVVFEAECVIVEHPLDAMRIGAANCLAGIEGKPFTRIEGYANDGDDSWLRTDPPLDRGKLVLVGPDGNRSSLREWSGGPFDAFADVPVWPFEMLDLNPDQVRATRKILERNGFEAAARVDLN